jgi:hypothetical protein
MYYGLPGTYLDWGVGARAMGIGKAFTALADDASAMYYNPAGMVQVRSGELTGMVANLFEDTIYGFSGFIHPTQQAGVFGIGAVVLNSIDFEERNMYKVLGKFSDIRRCIFISYAKRIAPRIAWGSNMKIVSHRMAMYHDTKMGLDIGMLFGPWWQYLTTGIVVKNIITPKLKLDRYTEVFPIVLQIGVSVRMLNNNLIFNMDINKSGNQLPYARFGGEYWLRKKTIALRAGIDDTEICAGFGIKFDNYWVDYAFGMQDIGYMHRVSFTWCFDTFGIQLIAEPKVFSPVGKFNETKIKIRIKRIEKIKGWSLTIMNKEGYTVRYFEGKDEVPLYVIWDGRDEKAQVVPDGEYKCILEIMDKAGDIFRSIPEKVYIMTTVPEITVPMKIGE